MTQIKAMYLDEDGQWKEMPVAAEVAEELMVRVAKGFLDCQMTYNPNNANTGDVRPKKEHRK